MRLRLRERTLELIPGSPALMGIVNAGPDSFSDPGPRELEVLVARGRAQATAGAAVIDVGGESGRTDRPPVGEGEEIARIEPVVRALASDGVLVSVDTWRAPVARAALEAGAAMVNDVGGLSDPEVAAACAEVGAALVITHTPVPPKVKAFPSYGDVVEDVRALLAERVERALERGVGERSIVLDPGLDLGKTPLQSVELLRRLPELADLAPLLVAPSRKDFLGALTDRAPADRLAGTLAAVGAAADGGASLVRVHDVAAAADYLRVRAAVRGEEAVPPDLELPETLRREREPVV